MDAVQIKNFTLAAVAAIGSAVAHSLGGWDAAMKVLVAMMASDYITGVLLAMVWQRSNKSATGALDSKAGFKGLIKKGMILLKEKNRILLKDTVDYNNTWTEGNKYFTHKED